MAFVGKDLRQTRGEEWCTLTFMRSALLLLLSCALVRPVLHGAQSVPAAVPEDYSGMYSFLRDAAFVQITVDEKGRVTGFISRFGDSESDKGVFRSPCFRSGQ